MTPWYKKKIYLWYYENFLDDGDRYYFLFEKFKSLFYNISLLPPSLVYSFLHFISWSLPSPTPPLREPRPHTSPFLPTPMSMPQPWHIISAGFTHSFSLRPNKASQFGEQYPQTRNKFRDILCSSFWRTYMETELHICCIYWRSQFSLCMLFGWSLSLWEHPSLQVH